MPTKRKNAPGQGRKPKGEIAGKSAVFSTRIRPDTRAALEAAAVRNGRSLSQEVERRLQASLQPKEMNDPFLRAMFYYSSRIARHLGAQWHSQAWSRQAFKAACITMLNRFIPDEDANLPQDIDASLAKTPADYGRIVEWSVWIFLKNAPSAPEGTNAPSGSIVYAMPQARDALGADFDPAESADFIEKIGVALEAIDNGGR